MVKLILAPLERRVMTQCLAALKTAAAVSFSVLYKRTSVTLERKTISGGAETVLLGGGTIAGADGLEGNASESYDTREAVILSLLEFTTLKIVRVTALPVLP
jgi:hypothetical protein